jgi:predicted aldo/keto reductase-like oxidoreductase
MRSDSPALVHAAIKEGIILFDTAHGYQHGKNEEMLGEVFKGYKRDSFVLATKVPPEERNESTELLGKSSTSKAFLEKLDISLQRLKMDYVDILYVHGLSSRDAVLYPEMLDAVTTAKKLGKTKHVGVSTHKNEPEVIQAVIDSGVYEVVLTSINFKQDHYAAVKEAVAKAAKAGIGIVAMKTMAGGFHDKERQQPINCKAALKFVLQDEHVTTAIPGNTNFDQLAMNAGINRDLKMTAQEEADLLIGKSQGSLYCQGCEHCVPNCPKGLPIPEIMRAYMYTYGYRDSRQAQDLLLSLNISNNSCAGCAQCSATCTKNFAISERITDVMRLTTVPEEFLS